MTEPKKNKGGRPPVTLTDDQILEIEELAQDLNIEQIADYLGIGESTFYEVKKRDARVSRAYKKGKAKSIRETVSMLRAAMRGGDITAMIFHLKTQGGWSTSENKSYVKAKFKFVPDQSPGEIIDSLLYAVVEGLITTQEAVQISNLVITKSNIKTSEAASTQMLTTPEGRDEMLARMDYLVETLKAQEVKANPAASPS